MEQINLNKFVYQSDDYQMTFESCSLDKILNQFNGSKDNGRVIFKANHLDEGDVGIQYGYISSGKFEEYEEKF